MSPALPSNSLHGRLACAAGGGASAAPGAWREGKAASSPPHSKGGFTFIEVLVTLTLLSIVLPGIMTGISMSLAAAQRARDQSQASSLAYTKLMEIASLGLWQQEELAGDFAPDWPEYRWAATVTEWDGVILEQLDVTVSWQYEGQTRSVTLSTLVQAGGTP